MKSQLIICEESEEVIATYFGKGKTHDYKLYEKSKTKLSKEVEIKADSGYQGMQKCHAKVLIPKKNSKLQKLTKEDKRANRATLEKANQGRKCDTEVEDISDTSRALSASEKKTRTQI